jgi:hypothetical protein
VDSAGLLWRLLGRSRPEATAPDAHARHEHADRYEFLRRALVALKFNDIPGDYAEFGCCGARTFCMTYRLLADYPYALGPFHLWAFDSFAGLPAATVPQDIHPQWRPGAMATSVDEFRGLCSSRGLPESAYTIVPGFFDQTPGRGRSASAWPSSTATCTAPRGPCSASSGRACSTG